MTSLQADQSIEIAAAPEAVFAVITDPARMPEWINGVQSAEWEEGSGAQAGGKFDMRYKYGRKTSDIKMEVIAVSTDSSFQYKTIEGPYPIVAHFTLRPSGDGTTMTYNQTAYSDSFMAALGINLTRWIAKPMVRRMLRKDLEKLRAIVEGAA